MWWRTLAMAAGVRPQASHRLAPTSSWPHPNAACSSSSEVRVVACGSQHRAHIAAAHGLIQDGLAAFLEQPGGVRAPRLHGQGLCQAAHQQAADAGAFPDGDQLRHLRERGLQAGFVGDGRDLAHAQVGDGLLHALHAALEAVQRRVDGLHHGRRERHVALDQRADGVQVDVVLAQQGGQLDQRLRLGRQVEIEVHGSVVFRHGALSGVQRVRCRKCAC